MTGLAWLLALALASALGLSAQPPESEPQQNAASAASADASAIPWVELKGGLRYRDLVPGEGAEARPGRLLQVHYTGWLENGEEFDSSRRGGSTYAFVLGAGTVVAGWDKGLVGMRAGGKRELLVPAKLAYGTRGVPGRIPGGATLRFEIELVTASAGAR
jgi:FKBP-type peptidyl-prolyl cis-trans isomerase